MHSSETGGEIEGVKRVEEVCEFAVEEVAGAEESGLGRAPEVGVEVVAEGEVRF